MNALDPQRTTGTAGYPPPQPDCTCGAIHGVHEIRKDRSRGACAFTGCRQYQPKEDR